MSQERNPIKQFRLALTCMMALAVLGTLGYHILEGWTFLDSWYMTVITLSTVGYKEVHDLDNAGKLFTTGFVLLGVAIAVWAAASLVQIVVSEQLWHALQRRRMQKQISALRNHYIICGYGRMGQ